MLSGEKLIASGEEVTLRRVWRVMIALRPPQGRAIEC